MLPCIYSSKTDSYAKFKYQITLLTHALKNILEVKKKWKVMKMAVGIHIIADMYGVDPTILARVERMKEIFEGAVKFARLSKISSDYYQFRPEGASGVILIAESHLSFHTWPEHGLVTLDIYTCGDREQAEKAYQYIREKLNPARVDVVKMDRGVSVENEEANIEVSTERGKSVEVN